MYKTIAHKFILKAGVNSKSLLLEKKCKLNTKICFFGEDPQGFLFNSVLIQFITEVPMERGILNVSCFR